MKNKFWFLVCFLLIQTFSSALAQELTANHERLLRNAISGSSYELHKMNNAWLIKIYAKDTFKAERPELLLPAALSKVSKLGRAIAAEPELAVLVLGMSREQGASKLMSISDERAKSVGAIFRISKVEAERMQAFGVGASPSNGPELGVSLLVIPRKDLYEFAAHFRQNPVFLASE